MEPNYDDWNEAYAWLDKFNKLGLEDEGYWGGDLEWQINWDKPHGYTEKVWYLNLCVWDDYYDEEQDELSQYLDVVEKMEFSCFEGLVSYLREIVNRCKKEMSF